VAGKVKNPCAVDEKRVSTFSCNKDNLASVGANSDRSEARCLPGESAAAYRPAWE
jgi:hypothetical protein